MNRPRRIEYVALGDIERAAENVKLHDDDGIAASIERHGFIDAGILDGRTGRLLGGHGRLDYLEQLRDSGEPPPEGIVVRKADGVVIFSRGASPWLGQAYDLDATEVCELTRVALRAHVTPVSQIVARSIRLLRATSPGLRLIVSFADPAEGHHGGVYQAGNWIYTGQSSSVLEHFIRGRWRHVRGSYHEMKARGAENVATRERPGKHRYLMPLDRAMRRRVEPLRETPPSR